MLAKRPVHLFICFAIYTFADLVVFNNRTTIQLLVQDFGNRVIIIFTHPWYHHIITSLNYTTKMIIYLSMLNFHDWYHCCQYSGAFHCNHNHYPHIFHYSSLLSLHLLITITVACPILGDLWKSYSGSADLADHPILSYIKVSEWSQCHHLRHHHYHHPPP